MEMHSILILITILSLIFALTYFITVRQKRAHRKLSQKQEPRFDLVTDQPVLHDIDEADETQSQEFYEDEKQNLLLEDPLFAQKPTAVKKHSEPSVTKSTKSAIEEIMYFTIAAKPNKPFVGYELLQALLSAGLRYGAMNIFHRHEDYNGNGKILFSVASASEPGTFEISRMGGYSGKGLMMFLRLSSNKDLMLAFETMLDTAKQLIEDLDGEILDDERKILSPEKIEKLKKKISEFEQHQRIGDLFDQ
ncbi:MAG: cell division protein ZipA [Gammaproteobacteria bacterium]|nr:cell division protein ZipA [Gammaproteobacteria bacterium]